jgi:hypothetical protein
MLEFDHHHICNHIQVKLFHLLDEFRLGENFVLLPVEIYSASIS